MTQRFYESILGDLVGDKRISNTIIGDDRKDNAKKLSDGTVFTSHLVYAVEKALNVEPGNKFLIDGQEALQNLFPEFYENQTLKSRSNKAVNEREGFRVNV